MKQILKPVKSKKALIIITIVVLVFLAAIPSIYFFRQYQNAQKLLNNPRAVGQEKSLAVLAKVGKLMELPNETPTVATVSDIEKLKDQSFFKNAKNGDSVLIFSQAKKAVIYRSSTNKIIEVSSLNIPQPSGSPTQSPEEVKVTVALYNGTTTVGLTKTVEADIEAKLKNIDVIIRENASKSDYEKTIVVDLSGKNKATAEGLANEFKGSLGELPEGETSPTGVDILVILGANR